MQKDRSAGAGNGQAGVDVAHLLGAPRLEDFDVDLLEEPERYTHADLNQSIIWMEYVLNIATHLDLAFQPGNKNPWLRFSCATLKEKKELVEKVKAVASDEYLAEGDKEAKIAALFAELLLQRLSPDFSEEYAVAHGAGRSAEALRQELTALIISSGAPRLAMTGVAHVEDSFRRNPFLTLNHVLAHAFNNALRGVEGITERQLDRHCGLLSFQTQHILPIATVLPGGLLGRFLLTALRVHLFVTHPWLAHARGIFALALGFMCKKMSSSIVRNLFSRASQARNLMNRSAKLFLATRVRLHGDMIAQRLLEELTGGSGAGMIARLFQLHSVNIEGITQQGENVNSAFFGGPGSWAASEGLFIGARDFGAMFHKFFTRYVSLATDVVLLCNGEHSSGENTLEDIDQFLNGTDNATLTPGQRLSVWCRQNMGYVKDLEYNMLPMAEHFLKEMVAAIKYEFKLFNKHLAKLLAVLYESAYRLISQEGDGTTVPSHPPPGSEQVAASAPADRGSRWKTHTDTARTMFRTPWMTTALETLANGLIESCASLSMLEILGGGRFDTANDQTVAAYSHAYKALNSGAQSIRASLESIYGRVLSTQTVLSKLQSKPPSFLHLLEDDERATSSYTEVLLSEPKFVSNALFALNLGVTTSPTDLTAASFFDATRAVQSRATWAFRNWAAWLRRHGADTEQEGDDLLGYATSVDEDSKYTTFHSHMTTRTFGTAEDAGRSKLFGHALLQTTRSHGKVAPFVEEINKVLSSRLVFSRFEREPRQRLRLYDAFGKSAIFTPLSAEKMNTHLRMLKPNPLQTRAVFVVSEGNAGFLKFPHNPDVAIEGNLIYADDQKGQIPIQSDPAAVRELMVAELLPSTGRVTAEIIANAIMILHQRVPIFRRMTFSTFLQQLTPKMLLDTLHAVAGYYRQTLPDSSYLPKGSLYTFPLRMQTVRNIISSATSVALTRMHVVRVDEILQVSAYGAAHSAFHSIMKRQTGRTAVVAQFQKEILHTYTRLKSSPIDRALPECRFLLQKGDSLEVMALKCALYRFHKLGSLDITQGSTSLKPEDATAYVNAAVRYLDRARKNTSWEVFLRFNDFHATAREYENTTGTYRYEALEQGLQEGIVADAEEVDQAPDVLGLLRETSQATEVRIPPPSGRVQSTKFLKRAFKRIRDAAAQMGFHIAKNFYKLKHKFFKMAGHRSVPEPVKIVNILNAANLLGALECAKAEVYASGKLGADELIYASDIQSFALIKQALERISVFLENPQQMTAVVEHMRTMPLVTPECESILEEIKSTVKKMEKDDIQVASGYLLMTGVGKGMPGPAIMEALLALADDEYGKEPVPNEEKVGFLRILDAPALRLILKTLMLAIAFKQMKTLSKEEATAVLGFAKGNCDLRAWGMYVVVDAAPEASISVGKKPSINILPLYREVNPQYARERLFKILEAIMAMKEVDMDEEEACHHLLERLAARDPKHSHTFRSMFSHEVVGSYARMWTACALYMLIKDFEGGNATVTVQDILERLMYGEKSLLKVLQEYGRATTYSRRSVIYRTTPLVDLLVMLNVVLTGGSFESTLVAFDPLTGHIKFYSGPRKTIAGATMYDTCKAAARYVSEHYPDLPTTADMRFKNRHFGDWIRFIKEEDLKTYANDYWRDKTFERIPRKRLKSISAAYSTSALVDHMLSIRESFVHSPASIAAGAAKRLIAAGIPGVNGFGLAMTLLELEKRVTAARMEALRVAVSATPLYRLKEHLELHLWTLEIAKECLFREEILGKSLDNLSAEEADTIIEALQAELSHNAEILWNKLLRSNLDKEILKSRAAAYIERGDVSHRSSPCLRVNSEIALTLVQGLCSRLQWPEVMQKVIRRATRTADTGGALRPAELEKQDFMNRLDIAVHLLSYMLTRKTARRLTTQLMPLTRLKAWWQRRRAQLPPDREYKSGLTRAKATLTEV